MDGGDTAVLGLYQVVDAKWSFVVSCDWQCRPLDEQTTSAEQPEQPRQSTVVAPPPQAMDENEAQIGWFVFFCLFRLFLFLFNPGVVKLYKTRCTMAARQNFFVRRMVGQFGLSQFP